MTTPAKDNTWAWTTPFDDPVLLERMLQEGRDQYARDILVPDDPELIRRKKEIRRKIHAEAEANNEMVWDVIERHRKEREKETEVRS